jgi:hypothetical protein
MIVHAAAQSAKGTTPNTYAVVLAAPGEAALLALEQKLSRAHVPHAAFRETDPPYSGALMSIGIEPVEDRCMVRRFLRDFKLLEEPC